MADRVFLADTMPFPNVLVKLSEDPEPSVRQAVAANGDDKNWLVGRLTKDPVPAVRDTALKNKRTSWKMRLEGAQDPTADAETLDFLGVLGTESEEGAPAVLSSMVRRAVALTPIRPKHACQIGQRPSARCGTPWKAAAKHTIAVFCRANLAGNHPPVHHCERSYLTM